MIEKLKNVNWLQVFAMVILIVCGTVAVKSAGNARSAAVFHSMWKSHLATAIAGFAVYFSVAFIDYRKILKWCSLIMYVGAVLMLVGVLVFGTTHLGGKRWLWFFQPSEVSKLCLLSFLAWYVGSSDSPLGRYREKFVGFVVFVAIVAAPLLLILLEPDLGTAITLCPATGIMLFIGNVWRKGLAAVFLCGCVAVTLVLGAVYEAEKPGTTPERRERILKYVPLRPHQVKRVKVYLFPEGDIHGAGYNLRQAMIAIGSGGVSGKGIGKAESNLLKYLPQSVSMNDFIFCVWAEETGFIGVIALLAVFLVLVLSGVWTAYVAADAVGQLLAIGITTLVFAHIYINIAMSVGMVPITGLPLPFISAGRTFLVILMAGLGFVQSVHVHRKERALI